MKLISLFLQPIAAAACCMKIMIKLAIDRSQLEQKEIIWANKVIKRTLGSQSQLVAEKELFGRRFQFSSTSFKSIFLMTSNQFTTFEFMLIYTPTYRRSSCLQEPLPASNLIPLTLRTTHPQIYWKHFNLFEVF